MPAQPVAACSLGGMMLRVDRGFKARYPGGKQLRAPALIPLSLRYESRHNCFRPSTVEEAPKRPEPPCARGSHQRRSIRLRSTVARQGSRSQRKGLPPSANPPTTASKHCLISYPIHFLLIFPSPMAPALAGPLSVIPPLSLPLAPGPWLVALSEMKCMHRKAAKPCKPRSSHKYIDHTTQFTGPGQVKRRS